MSDQRSLWTSAEHVWEVGLPLISQSTNQIADWLSADIFSVMLPIQQAKKTLWVLEKITAKTLPKVVERKHFWNVLEFRV